MKLDSLPMLRIGSVGCESVTALSKLFYRLMFGKVSYDEWISRSGLEEPSSSDMVLLSGKEALIRRKEFIRVIDLGHFWYSLTDMPFVPVVWQIRQDKNLVAEWKKKIVDVCELSQSKMHIDSS